MNAKRIEEIKKLPPKERLKRLKELEEERKKQEEESKKIIEESLKELKLDEMLKEIDVPNEKPVDINKLFEKVKKEDAQTDSESITAAVKGVQDYKQRIQELLPQNTIQEIQNWYAQETAPTKGEFLEVYENAREAYEMLQQTMEKRPNAELYSTPSQNLVENVVGSMRLLRSMGYKQNWFDN